MASEAIRWLLETDAATARDRWLIAARCEGGEAMELGGDKVGALLEATEALRAAGIPHALIGGVAVGVHSGVPRATVDTDLAVGSSVPRARVIAVLTASGFRLVGEFAHSMNFRHKSGEPVQLACDALFDPFIQRCEHFDVQTIRVPIVRKDDLIAMKERAAADPARRRSKRLRDQADVELLKGDVPDPDEGW